MADVPQTSLGGRILNTTVGGLQVAGGFFEATFGAGMMALPSFGLTQVFGVILIAHGGDTMVAGFRTLTSGEIRTTYTQQGTAAAARSLGASPGTAELIGNGVDIAAGFGPMATVVASQRLMVGGLQGSGTRILVGYMRPTTPPFARGSNAYGHNAVGVSLGGREAWVHFLNQSQDDAGRVLGGVVPVFPRPAPPRYVITEIAVTPAQAGRATAMQQTLVAAGGGQRWRAILGPNCTTTVLDVLANAGIAVPIWSRAPVLLHLGVRGGQEASLLLGTLAPLAPPVAQSLWR